MDTMQNNPAAEKPGTKPDTNALMGILSYIGPLVIVSYLVAKDDPFVKFHIKQGLVLFVAEIILWVLAAIFPMFYLLINLLDLAVFILAIIGIVRVVQGREVPLPFVGQFSKYFPI